MRVSVAGAGLGGLALAQGLRGAGIEADVFERDSSIAFTASPHYRETRRQPAMILPNDLVDVLRTPAICFLTTLMPDGSPQITQTWVDTDGENILINTVTTHQKMKNIDRDPRVAAAIVAPAHYWAARGRVTSSTTQGAEEHIEQLAHRYLGHSYPQFGGRQKRVLLTISVDNVHTPRR